MSYYIVFLKKYKWRKRKSKGESPQKITEYFYCIYTYNSFRFIFFLLSLTIYVYTYIFLRESKSEREKEKKMDFDRRDMSDHSRNFYCSRTCEEVYYIYMYTVTKKKKKERKCETSLKRELFRTLCESTGGWQPPLTPPLGFFFLFSLWRAISCRQLSSSRSPWALWLKQNFRILRVCEIWIQRGCKRTHTGWKENLKRERWRKI